MSESLIMSPSAYLGEPWVQNNDDGTSTIYWNAEANGFITLVSREHARRVIEAALEAEKNFIQHEARAYARDRLAEDLKPLPVVHNGYAAPPLTVESATNEDGSHSSSFLAALRGEDVPGLVADSAPIPPAEGPDQPGTSTLNIELPNGGILTGELRSDLPPLPQRHRICLLCQFGNCKECEGDFCEHADAGHPADDDESDGAFGEAQTWDEDES